MSKGFPIDIDIAPETAERMRALDAEPSTPDIRNKHVVSERFREGCDHIKCRRERRKARAPIHVYTQPHDHITTTFFFFIV